MPPHLYSHNYSLERKFMTNSSNNNNFSFILYLILILSLVSIFGCTPKKIKTDPNKINKTEFSIKSCPCDSDCYTNEVTNLKCDNKMAYFDSKSLPHQNPSVSIN